MTPKVFFKFIYFLFFTLYVLKIIYFDTINLDIRTSTSSSIDFAIASAPTNQCITDQSLTTAGNILIL